jgi:hypothetical protein
MKWIKSREKFLNEAKLRDVIFKKQSEKIKSTWGEKFLDYEEITPTDNIKQGKWKLSEEDKDMVLGVFFDSDIKAAREVFKSLPDKFAEVLAKSIDTNLLGKEKEKYDVILKDFNIKNPSIHQIVSMFDNIFRKLNVSETMATEMISRDESGRPIRDELGNMVKITKKSGDPIFSNNLVNINSWIADYNRCYPDSALSSTNIFTNNSNIMNIRNLALDDCNSEYKVDFDIFGKDIYLSISHNPKDILNMSISKFYSSCQHLYSGGYNYKVLGNVFDPNSIPAFLIFDTPIYWGDEKISDQLPLSRMIIRNMESFDGDKLDKPKIFFDRAYPDRMKEIFDKIIEKYTDNKENVDIDEMNTYLFTPDIDINDKEIKDPYMDRLNIVRAPYIGVNTKKLYLSASSDWSNYKISPKAKIKELIIETTDIPENLTEILLDVEWVKFKFIKINTLSNFKKLKTTSLAFDKCKFDGSIIKEIADKNKLTKLQLTACDVTNLDLTFLKELNELQLIYTLSKSEKLNEVIGQLKLNKLVISGDLLSDKDNKSYINSLKSRGVKVQILGPVI